MPNVLTDSTPTAYLRLNTAPHARRWQKFSRPVRIIQAFRPQEVAACLREVETLCLGGLHAAGFVSYEAAPAFDPALKVRPDDEFPLLWFALFEQAGEAGPPPAGPDCPGDWQPGTARSRYDEAIDTIRASIAGGVTYQTNFTLRLRASFAGDGLGYFGALAAAQPTEYAAYLNTGRWEVLSVSPELFFRVQRDARGRVVTTRPMKGTTHRGRNEAEDQAQANWLAQSGKNRAENVMIVDLLRNDLGRVAEVGSVKVSELCRVERYPTLHTMTSTVQARLREGTDLAELFTALFPCGSVTGAPKISTMQLIAGLEDAPRRVYCGAVGYVAPGGECVFNVPIRTVLLDRKTGQAEYGVGGGITWDSDAAGEYAELLTKAQVLGQPAPAFSQVETLRLQDGELHDLGAHLERLASSARYFGRSLDLGALHAEIQRAQRAAPQGRFRFRLLVGPDGEISSQTLPLEESPAEVRAGLARTPVNSGDIFLFHKTTHRAAYERAAAEVMPGQEALLHNERGELTEFVTGNLVLQLAAERYTPPLDCGLLAGRARRRALEERAVQERVLTLEDLSQAEAIWHLNSLRGWRRVRLG